MERSVGRSTLFAWLLALAWMGPPHAASADPPGVRLIHPHLQPRAARGSPLAKLLSESPSTQIPGLRWTGVDPDLIARRVGNEFQFSVRVRGRLSGDGANLVIANKSVTLSPDGDFAVTLPISSEHQLVRIYAVDIYGKTQHEGLIIEVPGWDLLSKAQMSEPPQTPSDTSPIWLSLGLVSYRYLESGLSPFNETALVLKLAILRPFSEGSRFDFGLSAFYTIFPLGTSSRENYKITFFGLNGRIGYRLPVLSDPWSLSLMTGVYFITTATTNGSFGFQNLMGPQLYPSLRRSFGSQHSLATYFKFSPVGTGFSASFSNREIAGGLSWTKRPRGGKPISVSLDYSRLDATIEGVEFDSTSVSISFGVGF